MNVIILALTHVPSLRDYALLSSFGPKETELLKRYAGLTKKIWNPRLFKSQVSPHEFLQEVGRISAGKFRLEEQGDPAEFLGWLLNRLHRDMGGTRKPNSSEHVTRSLSTLTNNNCRHHLLVLSRRTTIRDTTSRCEAGGWHQAKAAVQYRSW